MEKQYVVAWRREDSGIHLVRVSAINRVKAILSAIRTDRYYLTTARERNFVVPERNVTEGKLLQAMKDEMGIEVHILPL